MVPMAVPNNCFLTLHFYNFNKLSVGMCSFSFSSKASLRAIKLALCGILRQRPITCTLTKFSL